MKVSVTTLPLPELDVDLLLLPVPKAGLKAVKARLAGPVAAAMQRAAADFDAAPGSTVLFYPDGARCRRAALIGLGRKSSIDASRLREAGALGAGIAQKTAATTAAVLAPSCKLDAESIGQALVEGFMLASYRFLRYKTRFKGKVPDRLVVHAGSDEKAVRRGADRGRVVAEATGTARDLVNTSPHHKTPTSLAKAVQKLGRKYGFEVSVWDKGLIEDEKMGGLLAVNRGSPEPPVFIELVWQPESAVNRRPVVLVGKGIVFDTGGLSLKDTKDSMDHMKADMAGAAAVVGAMEALARMTVPLYVIGLIPATDNRPGGNAYVPGDVLTMHSGTTVEVLNTDAEGRLILADALSYAKLYRPQLVVDLATLTGAQVVALGNEVAALMANAAAREHAGAMEKAGRRSGDLVHPMPMHAHYGKALESDVADIKNVGGREAGSITAAKFLEHFVDYPWLHVDMAGPAFLKKEKPWRPKGGTGFGVRLLVEFLRGCAYPKYR